MHGGLDPSDCLQRPAVYSVAVSFHRTPAHCFILPDLSHQLCRALQEPVAAGSALTIGCRHGHLLLQHCRVWKRAQCLKHRQGQDRKGKKCLNPSSSFVVGCKKASEE